MSTILLVPLSLLLVLSILRRAVDPACPSCDAKSWSAHSTVLHCTHCGWTNVATASPAPAVDGPVKSPQSQYEFRLG